MRAAFAVLAGVAAAVVLTSVYDFPLWQCVLLGGLLGLGAAAVVLMYEEAGRG